MKTFIGVTRNELPQLLAVFTAALSSVTDGMTYGWPSPAIPNLLNPDTPIKIKESDVLWIESLYMIGGLIGLPITILSVNKLGRKYSILLASCISLIAWMLIAIGTSVPLLFTARILGGISGDVGFVTIPMYIAEVSNCKIRGFLGSFAYLMAYAGILVVYSVAPYVPIYATSIIAICILLVQLCCFSFMPESPYYFITKDRMTDAEKSLSWLRNGLDVAKELEELQAAVKRQNSERGRLIDLILIKSNRKAITIMTVLNAAQHFSSISVLIMNLHTVLEDADGILSSRVSSIIVVVVMFWAISTSGLVIDKLGRKVLLTISSIFTGLFLAILATYFLLKSHKFDMSPYNWVPLMAVILYALSFKSGLGVIPIVLTAELFPTSIKALGMTVADAMYVLFGWISIYLYQHMSHAYGLYAPFYLFSACCFVTTAFVLLFIPETSGKSLEEIQLMLKGIKQSEDTST